MSCSIVTVNLDIMSFFYFFFFPLFFWDRPIGQRQSTRGSWPPGKRANFIVGNPDIVTPTLNVNPTLFAIPCKFFGGIVELQCCNYYHLPIGFPSKSESSMTIVHHKLLTRERRVLANGWTHPSSMTIFVHIFIKNVIREVTVLT